MSTEHEVNAMRRKILISLVVGVLVVVGVWGCLSWWERATRSPAGCVHQGVTSTDGLAENFVNALQADSIGALKILSLGSRVHTDELNKIRQALNGHPKLAFQEDPEIYTFGHPLVVVSDAVTGEKLLLLRFEAPFFVGGPPAAENACTNDWQVDIQQSIEFTESELRKLK